MVMADWPDDDVPVITQASATATIRGDEPVLRLLLFDEAFNVRRVDLTTETLWELFPKVVEFLKMTSKR